jgi:hypothetical protein
MKSSIPTILYDPKTFPQAQMYAEVWGIFCQDLSYLKKFNLIMPTNYEYGDIYFAVKDDTYKDIEETHKQFFHCEYLEDLPDYRGCDRYKKYAELLGAGFHVFGDMREMLENRKHKEEVAQKEKEGIYLDEKPKETLSPKVKRSLKKRGLDA